MNSSSDAIQTWCEELDQYQPQPWERMPEIYLYMDQVINYMEKQLGVFDRNGEGVLTASMVNNYVKAGVLPRPEKKKYSRDHLAMLTMICMLKSSLSIPDISSLMNFLRGESGEQEMYSRFSKAQQSAIDEVCARLREGVSGGKESLIHLAAELSIEASMRRAAAEKILSELTKPEPES